ncbi:helix-turn-helix domain-containing protein [Chitinophaga lutea]
MFLSFTDIRILLTLRRQIEANPWQRVHIPELIAATGLSEYKLTIGFKQLFGVSIFNYYLECSMAYARKMLENGAQVKEVAITLGYSTTGSFSRAFVASQGILPAQVRLQR